jgi:hypothetical protein
MQHEQQQQPLPLCIDLDPNVVALARLVCRLALLSAIEDMNGEVPPELAPLVQAATTTDGSADLLAVQWLCCNPTQAAKAAPFVDFVASVVEKTDSNNADGEHGIHAAWQDAWTELSEDTQDLVVGSLPDDAAQAALINALLPCLGPLKAQALQVLRNPVAAAAGDR